MTKYKNLLKYISVEFKYSSIAQLVEHAAVNRRVVGSSPTGGANTKRHPKGCFFGVFFKYVEPTRLRAACGRREPSNDRRLWRKQGVRRVVQQHSEANR